ncbi:zinc finger CCCH domain-containing protein 14-like isoform X1 [Zingiber officinale]|uniref:C3H1-type domain-containing protein n=2 Tax=Zingiber officinale TaxID=94328 RepID=A0A8J5CYE7_ZINOF|nr:zinc finger CCCH domain-containing protein 14-like isoform X1 [Zingiber officinale]KAG6474758.1 hypothetical protein ZIOFF_068697 [Zingiber officinale]
MDVARKRGRPDATNGNGVDLKRSKEMDSFQPAIGSKLKPCTKFFSTAGCPYGEGCHFLHYFPGGVQAVQQITGLGNLPLVLPVTNPVALPPFQNSASAPIVKTRLCNKYSTAEGCKFGERCRFAHGEWELGKPVLSFNDAPITALPSLGVGRRFEPTPHSVHLAASFGASATAKISVNASLAGIIIGKGGVNTKQICRLTGAKLSIQDHDSDSSLKNIEMEGTFDQINQASAMVRDLIINITASTKLPVRNPAASTTALGNNFKTKICDNFTRGTCTYGDRCHFAHGDNELRKVPV